MLKINFKEHNEEIGEMWKMFNSGKPYRIPVVFGINPRFILLNPSLNKNNITFKNYIENPEIMFNVQLEFWYWVKHNIIQDYELGIPEEGWDINIDFQNVYESAWFGAPIKYFEDQVPDVEPFLTEDKKRMLFDKGIPHPFDGIMGLNIQYLEYFREKKKEHTFYKKPIKSINAAALGTDGPLTIASNLRGASEILTDFYEDPGYVHELLNFITEATIFRLKVFWKYMDLPVRVEKFWFADDSVQNISLEMYKEFVLPYHKKLLKELAGDGPHKIHLCGDASRLFLTIKEELNVDEFDTGFPIDFGKIRSELGTGIRFSGGPNIQLLCNGTQNEVYAETKRILNSGIMEGGNFILREANNLAPFTPLKNLKTMYDCGREYGQLNSSEKIFSKEKPKSDEIIITGRKQKSDNKSSTVKKRPKKK